MTTVLSTRGELAIPSELREQDHLKAGDDFQVERIGPGRYILEKVGLGNRHARLGTADDGLPIFVVPADAPTITSDLIKRLDVETP